MPKAGQNEAQVAQTETSDQKWWKTKAASVTGQAPVRRGQPCPKCYMADLDLDSLFRIHCPNCGYVAECGAFT